MRKFAVAVWFVAALAAVYVGVSLAAAPPDEVTIKDCQAKQPPVVFPHAKHFKDNKIECVTCHHDQKDLTIDTAAKTDVKACGTCHAAPEKPTTPSCKEMSPTKNPFHIRCLGCHKEKAKGPTKCADCHKKA